MNGKPLSEQFSDLQLEEDNGKASIQLLLENQNDVELTSKIVTLLGELRPVEAIVPLAQFIKSRYYRSIECPIVSSYIFHQQLKPAVFSLGQIEGNASNSLPTCILDDEILNFHYQAGVELNSLDRKNFHNIASFFQSTNWIVRFQTIEIMKKNKLDSCSYIPELVLLLKDPEEKISMDALYCLKPLFEKSEGINLNQILTGFLEVLNSDSSPTIRIRIAKLLGQLGLKAELKEELPNIVKSFLLLMKNQQEDPIVRHFVIKALDHLGIQKSKRM